MNKAFFVLFFITSTAVFAQQAKVLQFKEEVFDFGMVPEEGGPVTHEFVFTNNSGRAIKILTVQASCGCTTPDWSKEAVQPGKTGFIQASYNPKGRPGYFNKSLTVTTDYEPNPIMLQIKGQVSTDAKPVESDYAVANGSLRLKSSALNMGKVLIKDEYVVRDFAIMNAGEKPLTFTGTYVTPKYIKVETDPKVIAPGAKGKVRISYNGKMKNQYGFQSDNVEIHTDDETNPVKSFSVYATLEDYFGDISAEELAKAPQMRLADYSFDFGKLKSNSTVVREVLVTNTGKKELNLKSLQGNCTCIKATAGKTTLKPGDNTTLKIAFEAQDRSGTQTKAVTIYSNDPKNPVQRVTFTAYVD
jgi:hypothetical protein